MPNNELDPINDQAVYRRTAVGQHELLVGSHHLNRQERRFLGVVTGFTSLRVLMDMGFSEDVVRGTVHKLLDLGLVELVV